MTMACCNPKLGYGCGQVFANFYPERLGLVICINHNPVFQGVWKAIKAFLDPNTVAKVQLSRSKDKVQELFRETFPAELCQWVKDEVELNKQKSLAPSQRRFWECPADPRAHDPRGCLSYVTQHIEPYIAVSRAPETSTRHVHRPHPNIVDQMKGDVGEYVDTSPTSDTSGGAPVEAGACGELDIPDEYQIHIEKRTVTRM